MITDRILRRLTINKRGAVSAPLLPFFLLLLLAATMLPGSAAHAQQGGLAMAGTFYAQVFQIPPGGKVSAASVYVVVFNQAAEESQFEMSSVAPAGVEMVFSEAKFTLKPGQQKQVLISVQVSEQAVPGEYKLAAKVTRVAVPVAGQVTFNTVVAQQADLTITGESATVNVKVVSPSGEPVVSVVSLFKIVGGKDKELADSETGVLEAKVSPGSFRASASVGGEKLTEQNFEVAAGETKNIVLSGNTVSIGGFGVVPNYSNQNKKLVFVNVVYTINNFYQPMPSVEIILLVSLDGKPLEKISLATFESLNTGRTGGSYNYIPSTGWQNGEYSFLLELYTKGELYTKTLEVKQLVKSTAATSGNTTIILVSLAIGIALIVLTVFFLRRRKKRKQAKSER